MTAADRPWWSSGSAPGSRAEPGPAAADREDRLRREGAGAHPAADGPGDADGPSHAHDGHAHGGDGHTHADPASPHDDVCQVCPICTALRLVGEVRPDLLVHLGEAARHLTLAAKTIVDAQAGGFGGRGLEHIPLDDEPS